MFFYPQKFKPNEISYAFKLDIEISKRAKIEITNGEIEDYEDIKKELGLEDED
jgi:hypothetical protein